MLKNSITPPKFLTAHICANYNPLTLKLHPKLTSYLFGSITLSAYMHTLCQLDQNSVKFLTKYNHFYHHSVFGNVVCKMLAILFRPHCINYITVIVNHITSMLSLLINYQRHLCTTTAGHNDASIGYKSCDNMAIKTCGQEYFPCRWND